MSKIIFNTPEKSGTNKIREEYGTYAPIKRSSKKIMNENYDDVSRILFPSCPGAPVKKRVVKFDVIDGKRLW